MSEAELKFNNLSERHKGVSQGVSISYAEAGAVCLDRHHASPVLFTVSDNGRVSKAHTAWPIVDEALKRAWANKDDATRDGAYGLAIAAAELTRELVAVGRAETRTGADYYLGPRDADVDDFEACFRLEVSGTDEGTDGVIGARLRQKVQQASDGESNLPAIATVVAFKASKIVSSDVEEQ